MNIVVEKKFINQTKEDFTPWIWSLSGSCEEISLKTANVIFILGLQEKSGVQELQKDVPFRVKIVLYSILGQFS